MSTVGTMTAVEMDKGGGTTNVVEMSVVGMMKPMGTQVWWGQIRVAGIKKLIGTTSGPEMGE